jgi:hypothetical protein
MTSEGTQLLPAGGTHEGHFLRYFLVSPKRCDHHLLVLVVGIAESLVVNGVVDFPSAILDQQTLAMCALFPGDGAPS